MYLKSIKAYGFKSFADKIEINFEKNINGIVGPNGSGKSNVVDAVRWVLGEQSMKSLRGESSTDVIFSGSKSRKPLNSASITLTFDNTDLYLPTTYTEVSVRRVMYRSGENEYFLNNEKCRLKDITNLLTDSGADKESFNIISQGKIDEILSTKPSDRRIIFESAAGILKYKKRKEEALKKLERTNLNINRVDDILNELSNNLSPLERQSKTAKIFLEKKEELEKLEISLMTYDIHEFNYQTKILDEDIKSLKDEIVVLSNQHSNYDISLLEKKKKLKEIDELLNKEQNNFISATKKKEEISADIRVLKERKKHTISDINQDDLYINNKENILKKEAEIKREKNFISNLENELNVSDEKLSEIKTKYSSLEEKKNKLNILLDKHHHELNNLKYRIEYLENGIKNDNTLPNSIKNIMKNKRLIGVHNIIGKLIEIDDTYQNAISVALGGAVNYLVVDTREVATKLVSYLKENKLGRATFFPLDVIKPRMIDSDTLTLLNKIDGFVGTASSLVKFNSIYQSIIENQLGNILVASNLDTANNISKLVSKRYKVVTLDGQVVNVGGSITGGSMEQTRNLIKDKYELDLKVKELNKLKDELKEIEHSSESLTIELNKYNNSISSINANIASIRANINKRHEYLEVLIHQKDDLVSEQKEIDAVVNQKKSDELEILLDAYYKEVAYCDELQSKIDDLRLNKKIIEQSIEEIEEIINKDNIHLSKKEKQLKESEMKYNTLNLKLDNLLLSLTEEYNITYEAATLKYRIEMDLDVARKMVKDLKAEIKEIGYVNVDAIEEYEKVLERYKFLNEQRQDLKNAFDTLMSIINEMDSVMKDKFLATFEQVRVEFKRVFKEMFRGGEAELVLTDPDNLLETGIEIQAIPTGKNLKSISLLSGGEKTFTAISLLFAILNVRPVPFCLLDEVEAALDDANVESFGNYLYKYRDKTQFILITHKKKTMEFADILYGITMQESGVSKLVSVRLEDMVAN